MNVWIVVSLEDEEYAKVLAAKIQEQARQDGVDVGVGSARDLVEAEEGSQN